MQQNKSLLIGGLIIILGLAGLAVWQRTKPAPSPSNTLTTASSLVEYACTSNQTALAVLETSHMIEAKNTDFGRQVLGIDGRTAGNHEFWAFYVNGTPAAVGADAYQCQNNDQIKWQIETF